MGSTAVWLIPVVGLLLLTAALWWLRAWMERTRRRVDQAGADLRAFSSGLARAQSAARVYSPDAPEPYGPLAAELDPVIERAARGLQAYAAGYAASRESLRAAEVTDARSALNAPACWRQVHLRLGQLDEQAAALRADLETAESLLERAAGFSWEVAQRAQAAIELLDKASSAARDLHIAGFRGEEFQQRLEEGSRLGAALEALPALFFDSDPAAVRAQADQQMVTEAYATLAACEPAIDELYAALQGWQQLLAEAYEHQDSLALSLEQLREDLAQKPDQLDLERYTLRLSQLEQAAGDLNRRLAAPTPESLRALVQEARAAAKTAQADRQEVLSAQEQADLLAQSLNEPHDLINNLREQMAALEKDPRGPLTWDRSIPVLEDLLVKTGEIGPAEARRTPAEVRQALQQLQDLTARARLLEGEIRLGGELYERLQAAFDTLDPAGHSTSYDEARRLAGEVVYLSPDNWPKDDLVRELPAEVADLEQRLERVLPPDPGAPLRESRLEEQTRAAEETAELFQRLQARLSRIAARLEELEGLESKAEEQLTAAAALFNQVERLTGVSPELETLLGAGEARRLWQEGQRLADDLFQEELRRQGLVEKKVQRVDAWFGRVENAARQWLSRLQTEEASCRVELEGKLARLAQIAALEDPVVDHARHFLQENPPAEAAPETFEYGPRGLERIMVSLKQRNDGWQHLSALLHEIEEEVETGVFEAYEEALNQRRQAIQQLDAARRSLPRERAWPPTGQSIRDEERAFTEVEGRWQALRAEPLRATRLVLELGRIAQGYQLVGEQIERRMDRAEVERERIGVIEESIERTLLGWQQRFEQAPSPEARLPLERQLRDARGELEDIRRRYTRGERSYEEVEADLRALDQRLAAVRLPDWPAAPAGNLEEE